MRKKTIISMFILLVGVSILSAQVEKPTWTKDKVMEETYYTIGTQAYIYSITPFMMYSVLYQTQQIPYESYTNGVPFNVWTKMTEIANVKNTRTVMPNVNTLYASTWLDLRKEPVLLDVPAFGSRYYSIGLQDAYMNYFNIIGSRTIGGYGGKFAICAANYSGLIPAGYTKVVSPTPLVWMLMRIAPTYMNEKEIEACRQLQSQVVLTPMSQLGNSAYDPSTYNHKLNIGVPDLSKSPLKFYEITNKYMQVNPPPRGEEALMAQFSRIGFNTSVNFDVATLSEPQKNGLLRGMVAAKEMINTEITNSDNIYNGWTIPSKDMGNYGFNYLTRAAMTMQSIGGFPWEEAIYIVGYKDLEGKEMDGEYNYVLHFGKDELPQVNAFWSLTMYELPSVMLYDNPLNRYQMGPQIESMSYNKDGSLDIYIGHQQPKEKSKQGNWLPAPSGWFVLSLRMYNPKADMFTLDAHKVPLPGVQKIQ